MAYWNADLIRKVILEAGAIAVDYQEKLAIKAKPDGSVVTQADVAVEAFINDALEDTRQRVYMIGEETADQRGEDYIHEALKHTAYVIDPIDGTAPYSSRLPIWGVSIGYARNGRLCDGAVYLPAFGEVFLSEGDEVLYERVQDGQVVESSVVQAPHVEFDPTGMISISQVMARSGGLSLPNPLQALGCAVMPLCYLMQAKFIGYIGYLKLWDLAGSLPLLFRQGFKATFQDGTELTDEICPGAYNLDKDHSNRWQARQQCLFAPPGMATNILSHIC